MTYNLQSSRYWPQYNGCSVHFALVEDLLGDRLSDSRVVSFILAALVTCVRRCTVRVKRISDVEDLVLIAYGERCRIRDLWRRFSFGTRDQAWSLKRFCVAVILKQTRDRERFWYRHQKGDRECPPSLVLARELCTFYTLIKLCYKSSWMIKPGPWSRS